MIFLDTRRKVMLFNKKCEKKAGCSNKAKREFSLQSGWAYAHGGEVLTYYYCSKECRQADIDIER